MQQTWVQSLGQEDPLEKGMAAHSSILACRIPWIEEPGGLQSMGSQESDTTEQITLGIRVSACSIFFIAPQLRQGCPVVNLEGEREL